MKTKKPKKLREWWTTLEDRLGMNALCWVGRLVSIIVHVREVAGRKVKK